MEKINDETHKLQVARDATAILHFDLLKPCCGEQESLWVKWVASWSRHTAFIGPASDTNIHTVLETGPPTEVPLGVAGAVTRLHVHFW